MTSVPRRIATALATSIVVTGVLAGCGIAEEPSRYLNSDTAAENILTTELASDVSAEGVLLAAVLLRAGSIEEAVANGTVTPAEVDEARKAIDDSTLDLWQQRAELDRQ